MTGLGWPDGPATCRQEWLLRKLLLEVSNEQLMSGHGYTEGSASLEIKRLLELKKEQDAA